MEGWIKLHRKSLKTAIFEDSDLWHLWCRLLIMASYNEKQVVVRKQVVNLKPGQCIVGRRMLSKLEGCSEVTIRNRLLTLESLGMINLKPNNRFTLVTIEKWAFYQGDDFKTIQQTIQQPIQQTIQQTIHKQRNIKNIKNYKNSNWDEIEKDFLSN